MMEKFIGIALLLTLLLGCAPAGEQLERAREAVVEADDAVVEIEETIVVDADNEKALQPARVEETAVPPTPTPIPTAAPADNEELAASAPTLPGQPLFNFTADEPAWFTVDDDVMGGVSSSSVNLTEAGTLYFAGEMSLDNNGGFASARSAWTPTNLSAADGVLLRVLGDGNYYRLRIRTETAGREISYNAIFETVDGEWRVVYIPFAEMVPTFRGFVMDVGPLDAGAIGSFGLMLSDNQPGEFALTVDWIRAVQEEELAQFSAN